MTEAKSSNSRLTTIFHLCSFLVILYSFSMLTPILVGMAYEEKDTSSFLIAFSTALFAGVIGWFSTRRGTANLLTRDGFFVAVLFWLIFSAVSAMPFILEKRLDLSLTDAVFEGISGITTTGASVFSNIDGLPKSILFYRSQLNFLGGLGIIVLAVAVLPLLGIGGAKLYQSEMPGPLKEEKLTPRLSDTAKHLWFIYAGLALAGAIAFFLAGMDWFDALCHSLATVSLGGFSTHDASLGFFDNPSIELVAGVFSILAAVNFSLYFFAFHKRSVRPIVQDPEFRCFLLVLAFVVGVTCLELYRSKTYELDDAVVHGFFQATSMMTDNGLGTADYPSWPSHIVLMLLGASFFGGCVGSTCGGIKAMRFLLLYRQSNREIKQLIHPSAVYSINIGSRSVSDRVTQSVWGLYFLWIFCSCVFVWALVATGHDLVTAFGTVAACMNNMGIGYGETASNFGTLNDPAKWMMCASMLLGRLEIFPILIVFSKSTWRF
ncbi:MAG: TrkH family potassium uptake protein [Gammaproteobacteria bacterium]